MSNKSAATIREQFFIDTLKPGLLEWLTPPVFALGRWIDVLLMEKRKWKGPANQSPSGYGRFH